MLQICLISHFTISTLNFKSSISPYIYVHRKILIHTAESSSIAMDTRNPSYWPNTPVSFLGRHIAPRASTFFSRRVVRARALLLRRTCQLCSPLVVLEFHYTFVILSLLTFIRFPLQWRSESAVHFKFIGVD